MSSIRLVDGLPFVQLEVTYKGRTSLFQNVLIDTGSAGTILRFDKLRDMGLEIQDDDTIETIRGVGGTELVIVKEIDRMVAGKLSVDDFEIEVGGMDYGFDIDGIIGMDFLLRNKAVLDLKDMLISGNN